MVAADIPQTRRGGHETATILLLLVGGFILGVGWLAGVVMLWLSDVWSVRDKVLGTLVLPGGLVLPLYFAIGVGVYSGSGTSCLTQAGTMHCVTTGGEPTWEQILWIAFFVMLVALPILTAVRLARTSRRTVSA
ncbi:MAG TPA: hypothetical protein VFB25_06560 [Gaiellaceae bacterium]|nr:hypothetical protein [Gaiellaceae bacterium]